MGAAFPGLHKFLEAQQKNCPAYRAVRKCLRIFLPLRVSEMEEGLALIAKDLEFNICVNPVLRASVNHMPLHKLTWFECGYFHHRGAKAAKPELQFFADDGL